MSNRRYFAQGTDFYRLVDVAGKHEAGPYCDMKGARHYRSYAAGLRRRWNQEEYAKMIEAWKIQKLVAVVDQDQDYTKDIAATLEWVDIDG